MGNQSRDQDDYTIDELENILLNQKNIKPKERIENKIQGYDTVIEYMEIPSYNLHNTYFMFKKNAPIMNYFDILDLFKINKITDIMQTPNIGLLNTIITANVSNQYVAAIEFKAEIPEKYKDDPDLKKFLEEYKKNKRIHYRTLFLNLNNMISNMYYFLQNQAIINNNILICRNEKTTYTNYVTYNKKNLLTLHSYNKELITLQKIPKSIQGLTIIKIEPILKIRFDQQLKQIEEEEQQRFKDDLELNRQIIEHRQIRYHEQQNIQQNQQNIQDVDNMNDNNRRYNNFSNYRNMNPYRINRGRRNNWYNNNYYYYYNSQYRGDQRGYNNNGNNNNNNYNNNNYAYNARFREVEIEHPNVNMIQEQNNINESENAENNNDNDNNHNNNENSDNQPELAAPNVNIQEEYDPNDV
jgi:hypothetical protein